MNADEKKHRMTRQKRVIMEEIGKSRDHPDAGTVYGRVREKLPRISLATVYRNLEDMASQGRILKLSGTTQRARFDGNPHPHYHFHCVKCRKMEDIPVEPVDGLNRHAGDVLEHDVLWHRVDFFGICSRCREEPDQNA